MNLASIREQRAAKVAEMRTLLAAAETGRRSLTADEQTKFDALKASVTDLEGQEARAQFLDDAERRMQGQVIGPEQRDRAGLESRVSLLRLLQAQTEQRALTGAEAEFHAEAERRTGRKAQGGSDEPGNLQAICRECHARKTAAEAGRSWRPTTGADGWPVAG